MKPVNSFWEAFKQSVVLQGILTLLIWSATIYQIVGQRVEPHVLLVGGCGLTIAFWFNSKAEKQGARIATNSAQQLVESLGSLVQTAQRQQVMETPAINPPPYGDLPRN